MSNEQKSKPSTPGSGGSGQGTQTPQDPSKDGGGQTPDDVIGKGPPTAA